MQLVLLTLVLPKIHLTLDLQPLVTKKFALSKLYVKSFVLELKKLKDLLMVHQGLAKKVFQLQKLKKSKLNWKKLELQLLLNNRATTLVA